MAKPRWALADRGDAITPQERVDLKTARWVSWKVLDGVLRLLHPFMPFVTEELWQAIPHEGETLAHAAWPKAKKAWLDPAAEREIEFLQAIVTAVRNLRVESKIAPGRAVPVVIRGEAPQLELVEKLENQLRPLARIESLHLSRDGSRPKVAASAVVEGAEVFLPLEGLIDLDEERARLAREAEKLLNDLEGVKRKLRNQDFLAKARP
jgi:valyl-tRNA synthetase